MKKLIIIWILLIGIAQAQSKAGFYVVGGKVITVQDTSSRNYLKAIENAGVVPSVLQNAASNYLVTSEKAIGSYSLISAQYPFMGGTSATHRLNLNKPTGLASDFNIDWFGSVTHSNLGAISDGVTGYGETYFNPLVNIGAVSRGGLSFFSGTPGFSTTLFSTEIGSDGSGNTGDVFRLDIKRPTGQSLGGINGQVFIDVPTSNGSGFWYMLKNSPQTKLYVNSIPYNLNFSTSVFTLNRTISIFKVNTSFSTRQCRYAHIDTGLMTDDIALRQSRIVTFFNSMQNR